MKLSKEILENGCTQAAIDGEPVFILLGRDPDAPQAIREWARTRATRTGDMSQKVLSALVKANDMEAYQKDANKCPRGDQS